MLSSKDRFLIENLIHSALQEDIGEGDHTTNATLREDHIQEANLIVKSSCILAGVELADIVFNIIDSGIVFQVHHSDGEMVQTGDIAFTVKGKAQSILSAERVVLNCMQRMSGIATLTRKLVNKIAHTSCKLLDTRKTTPNFRAAEKWAVRIGGGENHRFGLFDMILIKDNHIDFCGGITKAVSKTLEYLKQNNLDLKIEIETRNLEEVKEAAACEGIHRIMLDNFTPKQIKEALQVIPPHIETEASGGINESNIVEYAETGVNFISLGLITHSAPSIDMSLKAKKLV